MKARRFSILLTLFLLSMLFLTNTFAEDYTQLSLPEGAKARLGKGVITDIQFSPDNTRLAIASSIGVWLYDVSSGTETVLITRHTDVVMHVAFSPDGKILASSAHDKTVRLWNTDTGKNLLTFNTSTSPIRLKFLTDEKTLVGQNGEGTVRCWDITSGEQLATFSPKLPELNPKKYRHWGLATDTFVDYTRSATFAVGNKDGTISLQNGHTHRQIRKLVERTDDGMTLPIQYPDPYRGDDELLKGRPYMKWINALYFAPDGKTIVSKSDHRIARRDGSEGTEGPIEIWDVDTGEQLAVLAWEVDVKFSGNGKTLALIGNRGCMIWDVPTRRQIAEFPSGVDVRFSADGKTLVIIEKDGYQIWDIATRREIAVHSPITEWFELFPERFVLSQDGNILVTVDENGTVALWETKNIKPLRALTTGYTKPFTALAFAYDGTTLASGDQTGNIQIWDTNTGAKRITIKAANSIGGLAFTVDNLTLISESEGDIRVWDVNTGKQVNAYIIPDTYRGQFGVSFDDGTGFLRRNVGVFTSNSKKLAIQTEGGLEVWDTLNAKRLSIFPQVKKTLLLALAMAPEGKTLAASRGKTVQLWDTHTSKKFATLKIPTGWIDGFLERIGLRHLGIYAVAFAHDGKILATGGGDKKIHLWDTPTHTDIGTLNGHKHAVCELVFSPDGKTLASGDTSGEIHLWELTTGRRFATHGRHKDYVRALVFSPDGKTLASISSNNYLYYKQEGTILLWDIPSK